MFPNREWDWARIRAGRPRKTDTPRPAGQIMLPGGAPVRFFAGRLRHVPRPEATHRAPGRRYDRGPLARAWQTPRQVDLTPGLRDAACDGLHRDPAHRAVAQIDAGADERGVQAETTARPWRSFAGEGQQLPAAQRPTPAPRPSPRRNPEHSAVRIRNLSGSKGRGAQRSPPGAEVEPANRP